MKWLTSDVLEPILSKYNRVLKALNKDAAVLLEWQDSVLFTDNVLLIEWPSNMVERDAIVTKLFRRGKTADVSRFAILKGNEHWLEKITEDAKIVPASEMEPTDDSVGYMVFGHNGDRCYYDPDYVSVIESIFEGMPEYHLVYRDDERRILLAKDNGTFRAALANVIFEK